MCFLGWQVLLLPCAKLLAFGESAWWAIVEWSKNLCGCRMLQVDSLIFSMRGLWMPRLRRPEDFDSFDLHSNSSIKICKSVRVKCCSANKLHQGFQSSPQRLKIWLFPWPGFSEAIALLRKEGVWPKKLDHGDREVRINDIYSWEHSVTTCIEHTFMISCLKMCC